MGAQPCPVTPKNDGSCGGKIHVSAPGVTDESVDEWAIYHASGMSIAVKRHRRILGYLLLIMLMIIGPLHIYNNDFDTAFHLVLSPRVSGLSTSRSAAHSHRQLLRSEQYMYVSATRGCPVMNTSCTVWCSVLLLVYFSAFYYP